MLPKVAEFLESCPDKFHRDILGACLVAGGAEAIYYVSSETCLIDIPWIALDLCISELPGHKTIVHLANDIGAIRRIVIQAKNNETAWREITNTMSSSPESLPFRTKDNTDYYFVEFRVLPAEDEEHGPDTVVWQRYFDRSTYTPEKRLEIVSLHKKYSDILAPNFKVKAFYQAVKIDEVGTVDRPDGYKRGIPAGKFFQ